MPTEIKDKDAQGDLADVVARASNATAAPASTTHRRHQPLASAAAHHRSPADQYLAATDQQQQIMVSTGIDDAAAMFEAAASTVVVDPYLSAAAVYGLQPHQHQQLMAVQISHQQSAQYVCCGAGDLVMGADDGAMRISPPAAPQHNQMIKRKSDVRKVVCIPAPPATSSRGGAGGEVIPSDLWAWRKYGQKPIKGSPYPRGYYRCSSSKGCMARKQVERSRSDPNMLVITYTAEHNHPWPMHRNVLAGYARAPPHAVVAARNFTKQQQGKIIDDNFAAISPSSSSSNSYNNFHLEAELQANNTMAVAAEGDGIGVGEEGGGGGEVMYELAPCGSGGSGGQLLQADEVFAELEELEPADSSMMMISSAANVYSRGVSSSSSNYEWHKF